MRHKDFGTEEYNTSPEEYNPSPEEYNTSPEEYNTEEYNTKQEKTTEETKHTNQTEETKHTNQTEEKADEETPLDKLYRKVREKKREQEKLKKQQKAEEDVRQLIPWVSPRCRQYPGLWVGWARIGVPQPYGRCARGCCPCT